MTTLLSFAANANYVVDPSKMDLSEVFGEAIRSAVDVIIAHSTFNGVAMTYQGRDGFPRELEE